MSLSNGSYFCFSLGSALQALGLALMAGGMLAIGAFCAPALFKIFPRHDAGEALIIVFMRYDIVLLVSLGLVLAGEALRFFSHQLVVAHPVAYIRYALMAALTVMLLISTQLVNPKIQRMQAQGIHPDASAAGIEFAKTHQVSEKLYKLEMLLAAVLILLTPWQLNREL